MYYCKTVLYKDLVQAANGLYEGHRIKWSKIQKIIKLSKL